MIREQRETSARPLSQVTGARGAHPGRGRRPVEAIPPGQGSARLTEIRATAAGTAAGTGVDPAKLGASVLAVGAVGDGLLGDMVASAMARRGVDTRGLSRKSGVQTSATILPIRGNGVGILMLANLNPRTVIDADGVHASSLSGGTRTAGPRSPMSPTSPAGSEMMGQRMDRSKYSL